MSENEPVSLSEPSSGPVVPDCSEPGRRSSKLPFFITAAVLALLADVVSKLLVVANIEPYDRPVRILGGAILLIQERNSGAAFSVGTGATVVLTVVAIVVVVVIARTARRLTSAWWAVALGLVLGGALGNLADRLLRAPSPGRGHVVDWIELHTIFGYEYPVFNLADSCITVGAVIALVLSLRGVEFRARDSDADAPHEPLAESSATPAEPSSAAATSPKADHHE